MNLFHVLTVILTVAKLAGYFPHSWWLVFLPSIISFGIGLFILFVALVAAIFFHE